MLRAPLSITVAVLTLALCGTEASIAGAGQAPRYYGQISQSQSSGSNTTVRLAGVDLFDIPAAAGGFSRAERKLATERNLNNALAATRMRSPFAVEVMPVNNMPVIRVGGKHVVTVDAASAEATGLSMQKLADEWANSIRDLLNDGARIEAYLSELAGDYLAPDFPGPYHFAQREAARLNHAADAARADLPIGLECSAHHQRAGFAQLMKREPAAAEGEFRQALALNADNERARYGLGVSLLKQGRLAEARLELERARALDHDDAEVHLALGQAAEALGFEREAMARYQEASLLQPDNPAPALYIADRREARNDLGRSASELNVSLKRMPDSRYVRLRRDDQLSYRLRRPM